MKGVCTVKKSAYSNRKSQRYYQLKFADTYYGEMMHYGLCRLAWADVRRAREEMPERN